MSLTPRWTDKQNLNSPLCEQQRSRVVVRFQNTFFGIYQRQNYSEDHKSLWKCLNKKSVSQWSTDWQHLVIKCSLQDTSVCKNSRKKDYLTDGPICCHPMTSNNLHKTPNVTATAFLPPGGIRISNLNPSGSRPVVSWWGRADALMNLHVCANKFPEIHQGGDDIRNPAAHPSGRLTERMWGCRWLHQKNQTSMCWLTMCLLENAESRCKC